MAQALGELIAALSGLRQELDRLRDSSLLPLGPSAAVPLDEISVQLKQAFDLATTASSDTRFETLSFEMEQVLAFIKDAQAELIRIRQDGINQASFFGRMPKIAANLREAVSTLKLLVSIAQPPPPRPKDPQPPRPEERTPQPTPQPEPSKPDWFQVFLEQQNLENATPLLRDVLHSAIARDSSAGEIRHLMSETLLAALLSFADDRLVQDPGTERAAIRALAMAPAARALRDLAAQRTGRTLAVVTGVQPTVNARALLQDAIATERSSFGNSTGVSTNGLMAALLTREETAVAALVRSSGNSLAGLRDEVFTALQRADDDADRIAAWRKALSIDADREGDEETVVGFASLGNDNPDRPKLDDKLGVEEEARAFARVAAARQVDPPLAFGVFGDWGSGKSFFMNMMQDYVDKLARAEVPEAKVAEGKTELFHKHIVPIRFNAWHYVDTNLWASLVNHIFTELDGWLVREDKAEERDQLFDRLATARDLTVESAERLIQRRRDQRVAVERLAESERVLAGAKAKMVPTPQAIWAMVRGNLSSLVDREEIRQASSRLGLDNLADNADALKKAVDSLEQEGRKTKLVVDGLRASLLRAPVLFGVAVAIVLVPTLLGVLKEHVAAGTHELWGLKSLALHVNTALLGAGGLVASATAFVGLVTTRVRSALSTLEGVKAKLDKAMDDRLARPKEQVEIEQKKLAELTANVTEAKARLDDTTDRLAEAAREYASGTGRGRLMRFVRERATDAQYSQHLGLVATVRRDFSQLSTMMAAATTPLSAAAATAEQAKDVFTRRVDALLEAARKDQLLTEPETRKLEQSNAPPPDVKAVFERIILYIDDLDRCPPSKVVQVLQAVHLLLSFPLFVVVVAVDARWVGSSLETHYGKLLKGRQKGLSGLDATPRDYLEKIFQVPYWVRPMTASNSGKLLDSLAGVATERVARPPAVSGQPPSGTPSPTPGGGGQPGPAGQPGSAGQPNSPSQQAKTEAPKTATIVSRALGFTADEIAFMQALAPYVGRTPRRALRFVNVYRVIKTSLPAPELKTLEEGGGYRSLMTQVAITTGSSGLQRTWTEVLDAAQTSDGLAELTTKLKAIRTFDASPDRDPLLGALGAFWSLPGDSKSKVETKDDPAQAEYAHANAIEDLRDYGRIALRYSFRI